MTAVSFSHGLALVKVEDSTRSQVLPQAVQGTDLFSHVSLAMGRMPEFYLRSGACLRFSLFPGLRQIEYETVFFEWVDFSFDRI